MVYEKIADYLEQNGISQSFICKKTGMSKNAVSLSLRGERNIMADEFLGICNALNVEPNQFMDDTDRVS